MRTSSQRTTSAVLRQIIGKKDFEMAEILGRSKYTIHDIESGRLKLSHSLATKMFHETGISLDWLLKGDPTAQPISGRGEPYTKEIFEKAQAEKMYYDQPHPFFRKNDAVGFCARLIAILEHASTQKNYYMALYKVNLALDSLRDEFGMDEKLYEHTGPHHVNIDMAVALLRKVLIDKQLRTLTKNVPKSKPLSKKKRRR